MKRTISGAVLIAFGLLVVIPGGLVTWIACLLVGLVGLYEIYKAFNIEKTPLALAGIVSTMAYYGLLLVNHKDWVTMWLAGMVVLALLVYICGYEKYTVEQAMSSVFGVIYAPFLLSYLYQLRSAEHGVFLVWTVFLAASGCDIFAYFIGRAFGKHKMAPALSPKKTIEGSIGGILGAMVLNVIYGIVLLKVAPEIPNPILLCVLAGLLGSCLGETGDLAASAIKRQKGIKDYGNLIPGHGGVMDRFDSIIFTAPAIYLILKLIAGVL